MDNNQNLTNAQNQPQTPPAGPAPRPPIPGPAQMGATPQPLPPVQPVSAMPNFGTARPATPGATAVPTATPGATVAPGVTPTATSTAVPGAPTATPASSLGATSSATAPTATPTAPATSTTATTTAPSITLPTPGASATSDASTKSKDDKTKGKTKVKGKGLSKKTTYIILSCVAGVVVIACAIAAIVIMNKPKEATPAPTTPPAQNTVDEPNEKTPVAKLKKEELLEAFSTMDEQDYVPGEDYFAPEIVAYLNDYQIALTDSYADLDELQGRDFYDGEYEADFVTSSGEEFTIVTPVAEDNAISSGIPIYVAFNSNFVGFDTADLDDADELVLPFVFTNTSEETIKKALPILLLTYEDISTHAIYDYEFSTKNGVTTLDLYQINVEFDDAEEPVETDDESVVTEGSEDSYILEARHIQFTVDLDTGTVAWTTFDDGATIETYTTLPVTEDELASNN